MVLEMSMTLRRNPLRSLSHDHSHSHAQLNRADMDDPENDRMRSRESLGEERERQKESGSMSSMAKKAMNGWRSKRNGFEFTIVPQGGPKLSDISKRRES